MEITRRSMLAGSAAATGFTGTALADWAPNPRYPDPTIKVLDPSFLKYRPNIVGVERLATGMTWSEGPVWFGDGRYLLWSDICEASALERLIDRRRIAWKPRPIRN